MRCTQSDLFNRRFLSPDASTSVRLLAAPAALRYIGAMPGLRVCIDVDDLDDGLAFYTRALGLSPGRRAGDEWVELLGAPCAVDLLAKPPGTRAFPTRTPGLRRFECPFTPVPL